MLIDRTTPHRPAQPSIRSQLQTCEVSHGWDAIAVTESVHRHPHMAKHLKPLMCPSTTISVTRTAFCRNDTYSQCENMTSRRCHGWLSLIVWCNNINPLCQPAVGVVCNHSGCEERFDYNLCHFYCSRYLDASRFKYITAVSSDVWLLIDFLFIGSSEERWQVISALLQTPVLLSPSRLMMAWYS